MTSIFGCSNRLKFERYSSKDPELNLAMDFVSGWLYSEHRGEKSSYAGVVFYENKKGDVPKALIGLTVRTESKVKLEPKTTEAFAEDIISKRRKFKEMELLSKSYGKFSGIDAVNIIMSYKISDKLYGANAKLISAKERVVVLKKNDKFYTIRYENTAKEFNKFDKAFSHILDSIDFKDNK